MKPKMKRVNSFKGWFEEYDCGCVSETERFKKNLIGYCGVHGGDRRNVYPELDVQVHKYITYPAPKKKGGGKQNGS